MCRSGEKVDNIVAQSVLRFCKALHANCKVKLVLNSRMRSIHTATTNTFWFRSTFQNDTFTVNAKLFYYERIMKPIKTSKISAPE